MVSSRKTRTGRGQTKVLHAPSRTVTSNTNDPKLTTREIWAAAEWHNHRIMKEQGEEAAERLAAAQIALFEAQNQIVAERQLTNSWKRIAIVAIVTLIMLMTACCLYAIWLHINGPEFAWLRERRLRKLGLDDLSA